MYGFILNVGILLVPRTFVILGTVRLPVAQTHPTKIMFTIKALHVIAAAIFLNTNMTFRTVFGICTDVIGRFAVVSTFGQP